LPPSVLNHDENLERLIFRIDAIQIWRALILLISEKTRLSICISAPDELFHPHAKLPKFAEVITKLFDSGEQKKAENGRPSTTQEKSIYSVITEPNDANKPQTSKVIRILLVK
jgi:hypothetical protein